MTFGQFVSLLFSSPELFAQALAALVAVLVAIGALGSALEEIGERFGLVWLVAIGQRLEAIGSDGPKLLRGSRYTKMLTTAKTRMLENPPTVPPLLVLIVAAALLPHVTGCSSTPAERGALIKTAVVTNPPFACRLYRFDLTIPRDAEVSAACARECVAP